MFMRFDTSDIINLKKAIDEAMFDDRKEISFQDLLQFGYDKNRANALIYSATSFAQYVEKVEHRDGIYYAILKF